MADSTTSYVSIIDGYLIKDKNSIWDASIDSSLLTIKYGGGDSSTRTIMNAPFNYYGNATGSAGSTTSTSSMYKKSSLAILNISDKYTLTNGVPANGTALAIKLPVAGISTYGYVISVDGGSTFKQIKYNTGALTIHYAANTTVFMVYREDLSSELYLTSNTKTTASGAWQISADYDSTNIYQLRDNNSLLYADSVIYRYLLLATTPAGKYTPFNNVSNSTASTKSLLTNVDIDPFKPIKYYNSTTTKAKDTSLGTSAAYEHVDCNVQYSFNVATGSFLTAYKPVYIAFVPLANGSVRLAPNTSTLVKPWPLTLDLPTTEDGYVYKYIGDAYSTTNIELMIDLPLYYFKDWEIRLWDNDAEGCAGHVYNAALDSLAEGVLTLIGGNAYQLNNATGIRSHAQGINTTASGNGAFASGYADSNGDTTKIEAAGHGSVAVGYVSSTSGNSSIYASGDGAIAFGCTEIGGFSITASGKSAIAGGYLEYGSVCSLQNNSISYGDDIINNGDGGVAIGLGLTISTNDTLVYGKYNVDDPDMMFILANGDATGDEKNIFTVDRQGLVYATHFYETSDERLKDFLCNIDIDFNKLKSIPKKYFTWKADDSKERLIGTSAQELMKVYPEAVSYSATVDRYTVDYAKLSMVALAAVDKLHEENEDLKARVARLEEAIEKLMK